MNELRTSTFHTVATACAQVDQPAALFRAVDWALFELVSYKLFTILMYDPGITESIRVYSNLSEEYPLGGRKKIVSRRWADQVVLRGEVFIGNTASDLKEVFSDHALIQSLGCASVINVPVMWMGRTVGTLNLLHDEYWYRDVSVADVSALAQLTLPGLLKLESDGLNA